MSCCRCNPRQISRYTSRFAATLEGLSADASSQASPDKKRDSELTVLRQSLPGSVIVVGGDGGPVVGAPDLQLMSEPLEPLLLPPVVDVLPEVPDRVGDTPLQVQTVIEAEPADDGDEPLDVPWVWDDKVCSPLLSRPPPPAGGCRTGHQWMGYRLARAQGTHFTNT